MKQIVDAPEPQIAVERNEDIVQQIVADHTTGGWADLCARSQEEISEVTQFTFCKSALSYMSVVLPVPQIQEHIPQVAQNIPQERVQLHRGADLGMPIPQIMPKMWR